MNRIPSFALCLALTGAATAQWAQSAPAASPAARAGIAMTYDPVGGRVLLFGGASGFTTHNDTWAWNGSTWTNLAPATSANRRSQAGMVWDANRGVAVLYGGASTSAFGGPSGNETWEFDGSAWTRILPTNSPGGLAAFGMAYDAARQRVVVYGGIPNSFFPIAAAGTWEYDGFDWTQLTPATNPGPRERTAMCYSPALGKVVLFGGIDPQVGGDDVTWTWDGTNWTALAIAGTKPAVRTAATMVYDSVSNRCVLYGGLDPTNGTPHGDTWTFDGTSWEQVATGTPSTRWGQGMAFDAARGRTVLFGGESQPGFTALGDTWQFGASFSAYGAGCAGSNGTPTLAALTAPRAGTTYSLSLGNLALASGVALVFTGLSDTVSAFGPLPADLSVLGLTGCSAYTSADVTSIVPAAGGAASWSLALPSGTFLLGVRIYSQAGSLDAGVNPAGITVSNAGAAMIGI